MEYLIQIITAFLGALGFSLVFNSRKNILIYQAIGGGLSWLFYVMFILVSVPEVFAYFFASLIVTLFAEIVARIKKTPSMIILIPSVVPMIPGASLYYTMRYAYFKDWGKFFVYGGQTLKIALSIALGVIAISTAVKIATSKKSL